VRYRTIIFVIRSLAASETVSRERLELLVCLVACLKKSRERVADQLLQRRVETRASEDDRCPKQVLLR
jgi:hypothetical protein